MKKTLLLLSFIAVAASVSAKEVIAQPAQATEPVATPAVAPAVVKSEDGFRITSIGQEFEFETRSTDDAHYPALMNNVEAKWGAYDFALQTYESWNINKQDKNWRRSPSESAGNGVQLSANRDFQVGNLTFGIGPNVRLRSSYNRYLMSPHYEYKTSFGTFDGWANTGVYVMHDETSRFYSEVMPLNYSFKVIGHDVKVGYYMESLQENGTDVSETNQQVRIYTPIAKIGNFSLDSEFRIGLNKIEKSADKTEVYGIGSNHGAGKVNMAYLYPSYNVTENFNIGGYAGYEIGDWNDTEDTTVSSYYGDYGITWKYSF